MVAEGQRRYARAGRRLITYVCTAERCGHRVYKRFVTPIKAGAHHRFSLALRERDGDCLRREDGDEVCHVEHVPVEVGAWQQPE